MTTIPFIESNYSTTGGAVPPESRGSRPAINAAMVCRGKSKVRIPVVDRSSTMSGVRPVASIGTRQLGHGVSEGEATSALFISN